MSESQLNQSQVQEILKQNGDVNLNNTEVEVESFNQNGHSVKYVNKDKDNSDQTSSKKLIVSLYNMSTLSGYKIGFFTATPEMQELILYDFIKTELFSLLGKNFRDRIEEDDYFADLRELEFENMLFTVMFKGAPYSEKQMKAESLGDFMKDNGKDPLDLKLHAPVVKEEEEEEAEAEEENKNEKESEDKGAPKKKKEKKLHSSAVLHELVWKESFNRCTGEISKVRMIKLPDKHPKMSTLKSKLRRITNLSLFYRDNIQFRAQMLLPHVAELKKAVWGDIEAEQKKKKKEQEEDDDDDEEEEDEDVEIDEQKVSEHQKLKKLQLEDYTQLPAKGKDAKVDGLYKLVVFLLEEFKQVLTHYETLKNSGKITFDYLHLHFGLGTKVYMKNGDDAGPTAGKIKSVEYYRGFFSSSFNVTSEVIKTNGKKFYFAEVRNSIQEFSDVRKLDDLQIRLMDDTSETYTAMQSRGEKFAKYGIGAHYVAYHGVIYYRTWCNTLQYKAVGRVMADVQTFKKLNPNYSYDDDEDDDEDERELLEVPEEEYWRCWTTVKGFSFSCKKWGEIAVDQMSPIVFDETAYDKLVLEKDRKDLIKSLVENYKGSFEDIISGKGGGCIFLLHGPPGTGKTLTAEAISELLHKPLYSVSVGELGTTISELEEKLRNILEVACHWDAVVLLDEADIFLERRSDNDIHRNAMVGIFLRLLEYHNGVLFLTTNRVRSFDEAFHSRISIALHYKPLGDSRATVWATLLEAAKIDMSKIDLQEVAKLDINGRQIKNVIRLSQTVSKSYNVPVDTSMLLRNIELTNAFLDIEDEKNKTNDN